MHNLSPKMSSKFLILLAFLVTATTTPSAASENPLTPKGYVLRYWKKHISSNFPKPAFLLNKASPLTATQSAVFSNLAANQTLLSAQLPDFCAKANLVCFPDVAAKYVIRPSSFVGYFGIDRNPNTPPASLGSVKPSSFVGYFGIDRNASSQTCHRKNKLVVVEPGLFFREAMLKKDTVMPLPDIRDKMANRSFLPRGIVSKLPFSTSKLEDVKKLFRAGEENSTMSAMLVAALRECDIGTSPGETRRCVGSVEEMIDFSTSVLGRNVAARTTENTEGHSTNVTLGNVNPINHGKLTTALSCHPILYPYLLYYCHSDHKVKVYEAEILDSNSKVRINQGVAICHMDTRTWCADHAAFTALGSAPGNIEVCHWIFENGLLWTVEE